MTQHSTFVLVFLLGCFLVLCGCAENEPPMSARAKIENIVPVVEKPTEEAIQALDPYTPSTSPLADSLLNEANAYLTKAKYDSVMIFADSAAQYFKEIDFSEGLVRTSNIKATAFRVMGNFAQAQSLLESALDTGKKRLGEDHVVVSNTYNLLGITNAQQGDMVQALEYFKNSLSIRKNALGDSHAFVARSLTNIGSVYSHMGDYRTALDYFNESLPIGINTFGETHRDVAAAYDNIAVALSSLEDYEQAIMFHERGLAINKQVYGEMHPKVGISRSNLASSYHRNQMPEKSLEHNKIALDIFKNAFPQGHWTMGFIYNGIGDAYLQKQDYDNALAFALEGLDSQKSFLGDIHFQHGYNYIIIANILKEQGEFKKAEQYYKEGIRNQQAAPGEQPQHTAELHEGLAYTYMNQGAYQLALDQVSLSLRANHLDSQEFEPNTVLQVEQFASWRSLINSLVLRARLFDEHFSKKDKAYLFEAFKTYQIALDAVDQLRKSLKGGDSRLRLTEVASPIYPLAIQTAYKIYRTTGDASFIDEAFRVAEKGKAWVLLDAIHEADARQFGGIPDSLLQREQELRVLVNYYDQSIKNEETAKTNQEKSTQLKSEAFPLRKAYSDLLETLENSYPRYYDLKHSNYTASISDVQNQILSDNEMLIEYAIGPDSLFVFLISDTAKQLKAWPIDSTFTQAVNLYKKGIIERNRVDYFPAAHALYNLLIDPIQEIASTKETWIIVPDDVLHGIPFEALLTQPAPVNSNYHTAPYLLNDHTIRYIYSATLELTQAQLRVQERSKDFEADPGSKKDFLAFAPIFSTGLTSWMRGQEMLEQVEPDTVSNQIWGHLPESEEEVNAISSRFNKRHSFWRRTFNKPTSIYLGRNASEQQLKSMALNEYRFVHFATHGVLNKDVPELSGIIMAQDSSGGEDGILHLGEIYNLELEADLVVLSACQTGIGKLAKGEGLMSLTRGFMYAGADAILATYWKITDGSAREIMDSFYENLLDGQDSAYSIRQAKLDWIREHPAGALPYYWASPVLIGK